MFPAATQLHVLSCTRHGIHTGMTEVLGHRTSFKRASRLSADVVLITVLRPHACSAVLVRNLPGVAECFSAGVSCMHCTVPQTWQLMH